jgi:predicted DCC family thiol-disulfide oxidoreductase YuxK
MSEKNEKIVLYDGDCGFCNRTVAYVLKNDKTEKIMFAAIQSEFAINLFKANNWESPDLSTFYFIDNGRKYEKSTAALKVAQSFSSIKKIFQIGWVVPKFIRDKGYDMIAKHRQKLAKNYCFVPTEKDRSRFL